MTAAFTTSSSDGMVCGRSDGFSSNTVVGLYSIDLIGGNGQRVSVTNEFPAPKPRLSSSFNNQAAHHTATTLMAAISAATAIYMIRNRGENGGEGSGLEHGDEEVLGGDDCVEVDGPSRRFLYSMNLISFRIPDDWSVIDRFIYSDEDVGQSDQCCPICLEGFQSSDRSICRLRCRHRFHFACITDWLCRSPTCPVCRFECCCCPNR